MARPGVDENLLLSQAMFLTGVQSVLQVVVTKVQKTHQLFLVVHGVEPHQTTCKGSKQVKRIYNTIEIIPIQIFQMIQQSETEE